MTELELKKYALVGMLVRIEAEEKRIPRIIDSKEREYFTAENEVLKSEYNSLLDEVMNTEE
jgi:hypothetical protein